MKRIQHLYSGKQIQHLPGHNLGCVAQKIHNCPGNGNCAAHLYIVLPYIVVIYPLSRGINDAGGDSIRSNAVFLCLNGGGFGKSYDSALGNCICAHLGCDASHTGGDAYDIAASLLYHDRNNLIDA